jgi:hypothetical protein
MHPRDRFTGRRTSRSGRPGRQRGQGLTEFALVLPVFMTMLIGMVDVGRAIWANNAVANAAREAARYASIHGGSCEDLVDGTACSAATFCPVGPAGPNTAIPALSPACPFPSPSKQGVRDAAGGYLIAAGTKTNVAVCYGSGCAGDTDTLGATNLRGTPVTVTVTSEVPMIVGSFLGLGTINVSATSTMLVNH